MKQVIIFLMALCLFISIKSHAQIKPAQSQYLDQVGSIINPGFEQGYKGWTVTGCTKSLVSDVPLLNKTLKLTCVGETFSIKQNTTLLTPFEGQQGALSLQIKSSADGVKVRSVTDSIEDFDKTLNASSVYQKIDRFAFLAGSTSNEVEIYSDVAFTGEIYLDDIEYGLNELITYGSEVPDVSINYENAVDLTLSNNEIIRYSNKRFDTENSYDTATGLFTAPISGKYLIVAKAREATGAAFLIGTVINGSQSNRSLGPASGTAPTLDIQEVVHLNAGDTLGISNATGATITLNGSVRYNTISIALISRKTTTTVTQTQEGGVKDKDRLKVVVTYNNGSNPTTSQDDFSIIDSVSFNSVYNIVRIKKEYFQEAPIISCNNGQDGDFSNDEVYNCARRSGDDTATGYGYRFFAYRVNSSIHISGRPMSLFFDRKGADENRTFTVVGKFENINSTSTNLVEATGNSGQVMTTSTDIPWETEVSDEENLWNGTQLTLNRNACYSFDAGTRVTVNAQIAMGAFINGNPTDYIKIPTAAYTIDSFIFKRICANAGDTISFRFTSGSQTLTNSGYHRLIINEVPASNNVVENLSKDAVKCQTKTMNSAATSTGDVLDLQFTNLDPGKYYSVYPNMRYTTNGVAGTHYVYGRINGFDRNVLGYSEIATSSTVYETSPGMTATMLKSPSGTIAFNVLIINNAVVSAGSYITLCELPDNYITTSEF